MCRRWVEGLLRHHERIRGADGRIDQYVAKRIEEHVGGGVAKKAGSTRGPRGWGGGPKVTPDSRGGDGPSIAIPRTVGSRDHLSAGTSNSPAERMEVGARPPEAKEAQMGKARDEGEHETNNNQRVDEVEANRSGGIIRDLSRGRGGQGSAMRSWMEWMRIMRRRIQEGIGDWRPQICGMESGEGSWVLVWWRVLGGGDGVHETDRPRRGGATRRLLEETGRAPISTKWLDLR